MSRSPPIRPLSRPCWAAASRSRRRSRTPGTAPTGEILAHLNVASIEGSVYVDPEDWSSDRSQQLSLKPGESRKLSWEIQAVNSGLFAAYVVVVPFGNTVNGNEDLTTSRADPGRRRPTNHLDRRRRIARGACGTAVDRLGRRHGSCSSTPSEGLRMTAARLARTPQPRPVAQGVGRATPAVSVIIATYNSGSLLSCALDALEAQTLPGHLIEVLVVDDGSTDDTWRYLIELEGRRSNIKIFRQSHTGRPSAGRNRALAEATGEYRLLP